jgi:hypothetical protein
VIFGALAALLWLVSAICWALSARVEIRDNIDAFVADQHQAARRNGWASGRGVMRSCGLARKADRRHQYVRLA